MATGNAQAPFNTPFKRAELLNLPQYTASPHFPNAGHWVIQKGHLLALNNGGQTTEPLFCIVVGTISAERAYLGPHGNFSPRFNEDCTKAKIQFTVARPNDIDFGPDFPTAIVNLQGTQRSIATTPRHNYFLIKHEGGGHALRMNFFLFEPRGSAIDSEREKETRDYAVGSQYDTFWNQAKQDNFCAVMPVFDTNDQPIAPSKFEEKLIGATCEITFTLRHYFMPGKGEGESSDTFSAHVESIVILKKPPPVVQSPYKRLTRRPHHKPQVPSRGEQVNAAAAFVPSIDFGSTISATQPSTSSSSATPTTQVAGPSGVQMVEPDVANVKKRKYSEVEGSTGCSPASSSTRESDDDVAVKKPRMDSQ